MKINFKTTAAAVLSALLLTACSGEATVPKNATPTQEAANIFPDYRDIFIPQNIAPLNIQIQSDGDEFVACIKGEKGQEITAAAGEDGKLMFDTAAWHTLLNDNAGKELNVELYSHRDGQWLAHPAYKLHVAEPIDEYLSYRLIEPSYELYRQMGLYQRNLTNFTQTPIYENNRSYDTLQNHCVNCHNYQAYDTKRMLFHVRGTHGGTIVVENGQAKKWNMKSDSILSSTVYPTWHPTRNWVVFSSNQTGQAFHINDRQKVEVMDFGSDLVFFDADKGTLTNILKTDDQLETFPCWAPDGKKLYYTSANVPQFKGQKTNVRQDIITSIYDSLHYNVMSLTFDEQTRTFGKPVVEMDCAAIGKSASVPRVSPDGRYLLFTLGDFGQFHIWHTTSDLYIKDLQTGQIRKLDQASSKGSDSYHTWSSNGRWIVVASRRGDSNYSRAYIAYFDRNGKDHKAFLLPQEDPEQNTLLMKSYNVPELTRTAVPLNADQFKEVIYDDNHDQKVSYQQKIK